MKQIRILSFILLVVMGSVSSYSQTLPDTSENEVSVDSVYTKVEKMAEFPGGINALMRFLSKNIHYPEEAYKNNVKGSVVVKFVITNDGKVTDAVVNKSVDPELDAEALRVVNLMPDWQPGTIGGVPVKSYMTLPITFNLQSK